MDGKKPSELSDLGGENGAGEGGPPRARNRTVMLTPEITGQVRARLAQESTSDTGEMTRQVVEQVRSDFRRPGMEFQSGGLQSGSGGFGGGSPHQGSTLHGFSTPGAGFSRGGGESSGGEFERVSELRREGREGREGRGVYQPGGTLGAGSEPAPMLSLDPPASHSVGGPSMGPSSSMGGGPSMVARPRPQGDQVTWVKESRVIGFLVSYDKNENGDFFVLRKGRLIVSSQAPGPGNYLILTHETVSPMHAILRIGDEAEVQVLDQLSECGTKVKRFNSTEVEQLSGEKTTVRHGDMVSFGERSFRVCLVPVD